MVEAVVEYRNVLNGQNRAASGPDGVVNGQGQEQPEPAFAQ
jgi:hypothetical protein